MELYDQLIVLEAETRADKSNMRDVLFEVLSRGHVEETSWVWDPKQEARSMNSYIDGGFYIRDKFR